MKQDWQRSTSAVDRARLNFGFVGFGQRWRRRYRRRRLWRCCGYRRRRQRCRQRRRQGSFLRDASFDRTTGINVLTDDRSFGFLFNFCFNIVRISLFFDVLRLTGRRCYKTIGVILRFGWTCSRKNDNVCFVWWRKRMIRSFSILWAAFSHKWPF